MKTRTIGLITGLLAGLFATDAGATNPHYNLCFNPSGANWGTATIDGTVDGSGEWINAFQYVFDNGTNSPDVAVRGKSDGTNLYFGVEVKNDPSLDDQDAIVLAFATGATSYTQLTIYPLVQGVGAIPANPARLVEVRQGTGPAAGPISWTAPVNNPAWITVHSRSSTGSVNSWTSELGFPISQIFATVPAGSFPFYLNVVRADTHNPANLVAREFPWPRHDADSTADTDILDDINNLPAPSTWGNGKLNGNTCGGLYIDFTDIHTNNGDPTQISVDHPNVFQTRVHNTSVDAMGNPKAATGVVVTFSYTDFGLHGTTGPWTLLPAPGNPTAPKSVANGALEPFATGAWTAPADMVGHHWCVQAALSSTTNDTTFLNRATWNNMRVEHGSTLVANAIAAGTGLPPPPAGKTSYTFRIDVGPSLQFAFSDGNLPAIPQATLTAQMTLLFHAAYYRDHQLRIQNKTFQIVGSVASYGLVVQHALPLDFQKEWESRHDKLVGIKRQVFASESPKTRGPPTALQRTEMVAQLNAVLAADPEQPPMKDWAWQTPVLKPLGDGGLTFTLEVPKDGTVPLVSTVAYQELLKGPIKTCATCNFGSGSEAAGSMALLLAVALVVRRRRRR